MPSKTPRPRRRVPKRAAVPSTEPTGAASGAPLEGPAAASAPNPARPIAELRLAVDSRLDQVPLLGLVVRHLVEELGWPDSDAADLDLAVAEAASNAVRHAYAGEAGHEVTLTFRAFPDLLEVAVGDRGRSMPASLLPPRLPAAATGDLANLSEGGRGLYLIHRVTDSLEYASGPDGNTLAFAKRRRPPTL